MKMKTNNSKKIGIKLILSFLFIILITVTLGIITPRTFAQSTNPTIEAKIISISGEEEYILENKKYTEQNLVVQLENKNPENPDSTLELKYTNDPASGRQRLEEGDDILLTKNGDEYIITDVNRKKPILYLSALFALCVVVITRKWGIYSIIGMIYSFFIIFKFILPNILSGYDPVLVALAGSLLISPVTFTLSHGINKKTVVAVLGTFIALSITGLISYYFVDFAKLTGFGSEEALFLQIKFGDNLNMQGILLAGIIIGTLGILDDVTVSQASIVKQLINANPKLNKTELYKMAMDVGHDHISSAVNTLILVYAGASMPLLLMFLVSDISYTDVINFEIISEEILRTLAGSIGLVLAVPLTTFLAVHILEPGEDNKSWLSNIFGVSEHSSGHHHHHHHH